jgi:hypothetical protein
VTPNRERTERGLPALTNRPEKPSSRVALRGKPVVSRQRTCWGRGAKKAPPRCVFDSSTARRTRVLWLTLTIATPRQQSPEPARRHDPEGCQNTRHTCHLEPLESALLNRPDKRRRRNTRGRIGSRPPCPCEGRPRREVLSPRRGRSPSCERRRPGRTRSREYPQRRFRQGCRRLDHPRPGHR